MKLDAKEDSWEWFFNTIFGLKNLMERADGKSLGNFWAIVQHLEGQYNKKKKTVIPSKEVKPEQDIVRSYAFDLENIADDIRDEHVRTLVQLKQAIGFLSEKLDGNIKAGW